VEIFQKKKFIKIAGWKNSVSFGGVRRSAFAGAPNAARAGF
jgi:hypothetical protein